tara:strand:+ start:54 stop:479 length:426 start_codon:yes stop_codon:yes gene_type:complete
MKTKAPTFFWIISVIALLWNLMGCIAYLGMQMMPPELLEAMPEAERTLMENTPVWATAAFAVAVWFGLLGSILLLLRKALSQIVFVISLLGIIVQQIWNFTNGKSFEVFGVEQAIMPIVVVLIGIYLIVYAKKAKENNWIN